jgi:hypothetical protein
MATVVRFFAGAYELAHQARLRAAFAITIARVDARHQSDT